MKTLTDHKKTLWDNIFSLSKVKKYFKGDFKRQIFLTIYDKVSENGSWGSLYLTSKNTLLSVQNLPGLDGIYELENTDKLKIVQDTLDIDLKKIITTDRHSEKYLNVDTSNAIQLLELNSRYLIVLNIRSNRKYGSYISGAVSIKYLLSNNYVEKVHNVKRAIEESINGKLLEIPMLFHGLSPVLSTINYLLGLIIFFSVAIVIIFVIIHDIVIKF